MTAAEPLRILIVDDLPKNIQVVANILEHEGYDLAGATSGKTALEQLEKCDFDLILLDIMMPEMDGFETCQRIKSQEKYQDLPIIFLTAKTEVSEIVHGFEEGAVDYITKPFHAKELLVRVKNHLSLREARKRLHQQNEELLQANATKDKFFSIMAHDLKGPFNGLIGLTQLLIDEYDQLDDETILQSLKSLRASSASGYELTTQLLDWARSQTGQLKIHLQNVNLKPILKQSLNLYKEQAEKKEITLNWEEADLWVHADPAMAATCIRNLLGNAIKFTMHHGKVDVICEVNDEGVTVAIQDDGIGIPQSDLGRLFQLGKPYTRHGTDQETGTGLGLILCKEFIERQGGSILLESEENQGSRFTLFFRKLKEESTFL